MGRLVFGMMQSLDGYIAANAQLFGTSTSPGVPGGPALPPPGPALPGAPLIPDLGMSGSELSYDQSQGARLQLIHGLPHIRNPRMCGAPSTRGTSLTGTTAETGPF